VLVAILLGVFAYFAFPLSKTNLGLDLQGGLAVILEAPEGTPGDKVDQALSIIQDRVNRLGVAEPEIQRQGERKVSVQLPGIENPEEALEVIGKTAVLEFHEVSNFGTPYSSEAEALKAANVSTRQELAQLEGFHEIVHWGTEAGAPSDQYFMVTTEPELTGAMLENAAVGYELNNKPKVDMKFNDQGADLFAALTKRLADQADITGEDQLLAIVLDGEVESAPRVLEEISGGSAEITGNFSMDEAKNLVLVLKTGALPVELTPVSQSTVGATLGKAALNQGLLAGFIGLLLIMVFIIAYYRFLGVVASVALIIYGVLFLGILNAIGVTMTLPGIAGMILTLGMAVDANVLIYERMREELERNATLRMAIRNGFVRAWSAIFDSNITTIMTAVILYVIGTDQIRGFAVTLFLGLAISMYTAIYMARTIFDIAERRKVITHLKMLKMLSKTNIDFLGLRWPAITASLILIVIGLAAVFTRGQGLLDIDFTGGVSVEAYFRQPKDISVIRSQLADLPDLVVYGLHSRTDGPNRHFVINTSILPNMDAETYLQQVQEKIAQTFGDELVRYKVDVSVLESQPAESTSPPSAAPPANQQGRRSDLPADNLLASADPSALWMSQAAIAAEPAAEAETAGESAPDAGDSTQPQPSSEAGTEAPAADSGQMAEGAAPEPAAADGAAPAGEAAPPNEAAPAAESEKPEAPAEEAAPSESAEQPAEMAPEQPAADQAAPAAEQPAAAEPAPAAEPTAAEQSSPPAESAPEATPAQATTDQASEMPAEQPAAETPAAVPTGEPPASPPNQPSGDAAAPSGPEGQSATATAATVVAGPTTTAKLSFEREHRHETIADMIHQIINRGDVASQATTFDLTSEDYQPDEDRGLREWTVTLHAPADEAQKLLDALKRETNEKVYFPASNTIGGAVAASTRRDAAAAILASLVAIIAYLWVRFQKVMYGLAAAVALVHDVLVTLGLLALSKYLVDLPVVGAFFSNVLLMDPFKIGLSSLAAFLTIIGYSLNDTIVIFDRIREIKGKSPRLTEATINLAVNQTLSRTILTALTCFIVVVVLYIGGGPTIHAFSFAMVVGVVAGSYSTVFMAGPMLVWLGGAGGTPQSPKPAEKAKV